MQARSAAAARKGRADVFIFLVGMVSGVLRNGTSRVGAPLAPRSRIEPRARKAGKLHRVDVVACGDSGPAHVHALRGRCAAEERIVFLAQLARGLEAPVW